ncbi:MAG: PIN domain-containing protein [Actinobacteria bacterium]|nr:PIN domain-containing protein [Actinomycetota bacterium]
MTIFVDTSALFAVLDSEDNNHNTAKEIWLKLLANESKLLCSNYILVESFALIQRRLGIEAVSVFQNAILPVVNTFWIDEQLHLAATSVVVLAASRRKLSLVDCSSFIIMRKLSIETAFTFDKHFLEEGFTCLGLKYSALNSNQ